MILIKHSHTRTHTRTTSSSQGKHFSYCTYEGIGAKSSNDFYQITSWWEKDLGVDSQPSDSLFWVFSTVTHFFPFSVRKKISLREIQSISKFSTSNFGSLCYSTLVPTWCAICEHSPQILSHHRYEPLASKDHLFFLTLFLVPGTKSGT